MPRTPEVCPDLFCPLSHISNIAPCILGIVPHALRYLQSGFGSMPSYSCRLPTAVRRPRYVFCVLLLLTTCHCSLVATLAQGTTATLSGTVTDQNDAVIPDVSIAVINIAQGFQRSATTNREGAFVVPLLPPGSYAVKAEHKGFTPTEVRDVVLNVNDQVTIKIHMNVGTISQTVQIVEGISLINESPAVSTVVDRQFVANLPLNGRSFQSLITLTPGVVLTKTAVSQQGQFSVNGQRASANYFMVDGVSANVGINPNSIPGQSGSGSLPGLTASGGTNNLVSVDALQEFKIQTSSYAPEFGRTPGAQISIVSRSGTKDFHGTLFEYFRNDVLDANDWFANRAGQPKAKERQNDFGGVVGGPIVFPRFGEGTPYLYRSRRSFFFLSYEGLRLRQPLVGVTDVPSLTTRQQAPAAVQPIVNLYPRPNGPNKTNGLAAFTSSFSNPATVNATSIRIDGNASDSLILFGRYNYAPSQTTARGGVIQTLNTLSRLKSNTQTLTLGATYLPTSTISNDLRLNYSRYTADSFFELDDFGGAVVPPAPLLFSSDISGANAGFTLQLTGAQNGTIVFGRSPRHLQRQFNLVDSISVTRGSHQLKFGVDYRRLSPVFNLPPYSQTLIFNGVGNPASPAAGTLLSGRLSSAQIISQKSPQVAIFSNLSLFGQDAWKVTPRLTFSYGLRWEVNPPPHEANGNDPLTLTQITDPSTFAFAPRGTNLWKTTYNNFAPRIGLAYEVSNKQGRETMLCGGFGLFYDLGEGPASNAFVGSFPFTALKTLTNVPFPLSTSNSAAPVAESTPSATDSFFSFDPNLELPRVYQWNVSIQQSVGVNQSFTASYVAAVGRRLIRLERIRNANSNFPGTIFLAKNDATSDYHAMQLQFRRRLSKGLQALASYTWSKSLDIVSDDSVNTNPANRIDPNLDRGPSDFDVRHAFNGALTYNLPTSDAGEVVRKIMADWAMDGILTARSATPVNVTYAVTNSFGVFTLRPDLVPGISLYLDDPSVPRERRFNNTQTTVPGNPLPQIGPFLRPTVFRQGTLGRNVLRGFPVWQLDVAVRRQFNLTEQANLQFRAEFFNIFNHPNFGDPTGTLNSSTFGVSNSMFGKSLGASGITGGFNPLYQVGGPRSIQFSLKFQF